MNKKTFFRLAQPAATTLLALSIFSIPAQLKAYGDKVNVEGSIGVTNHPNRNFPLKVSIIGGCN